MNRSAIFDGQHPFWTGPATVLLIALCLCGTGIGVASAADDKDSSNQGGPPSTIFVAADPSPTNELPKLLVDFVWAPYCGYSVRTFHNIIWPFYAKYVLGGKGRVAVRFTQATRNKTELDGPGPLLICVPREHYPEFVADYLLTAYENKAYLKWSAKEKFRIKDKVVYKFLVDVGRKHGLPADISTCYTHESRIQLLATNVSMSKEFDHPTGTPVIAINGTVVKGIDTAKQFQDAVEKALKKADETQK